MDLFCLLRLGFLGLLHMEVFNQRLEQEYNASVIVTAPTVPYKAVLASAKLIKVEIMIGWDNFAVSCILCMFYIHCMAKSMCLTKCACYSRTGCLKSTWCIHTFGHVVYALRKQIKNSQLSKCNASCYSRVWRIDRLFVLLC